MRTRLFLGSLVLLCALAFVVPAQAVTINGVDYLLFAQCKIGMEDGGTNITGNIAVNEICGTENGFLRIGAHNIVNGSATANRMFFGTSSTVTTCNFNISTGGNANATCGSQNAAVLPITAWPPLPVPTVNPSATNFTCQSFQICNLPAGAYRDIRAKDNSVLNLDGGTYEARNLTIENKATLNGNSSAVNLTNVFSTEPNATINDVNITSIKVGTVEVMVTGNNSTINNSLLYAPFARAHLHQNTIGQGTETVAVLITVEPITLTPPPPAGCACVGEVAKGASTIDLSNGCGLNNAANLFFVATTCAINCPGAGCTATTVSGVPSATSASLNIPVVPAGDYHVIVVSPGGQFCTAATVPLP